MPNMMRWVTLRCDKVGRRPSGPTRRHSVTVICRMVLKACLLLDSLPTAPCWISTYRWVVAGPVCAPAWSGSHDAESLPAAVQGRHTLTQVEHTQKEVSQAEAELAQAKERAQTREKEAAEAQRQAHVFNEL